MPFWQRVGAIFEHFWSIFGPRVHFYNYVLYDSEQGTKRKKNSLPFRVTFGAVWGFGGVIFLIFFWYPSCIAFW